ncbi:ferritin family protein [Natronomonas gomsonensis]|uniref:ferritin family protein n=1 Tax=Natronomonas gomsonensis TaxID=1046043 RepID=UPI0015BEF086|nr:ferritin family protein [Natronomonas gomsonensis]
MTDSEFVESVREANNTALSRLGSSKSLYADTMGEMDVEEVLRAAATAEHHAAETYETWAETADGDVADAFAETAAEERDHYDTVVGELDGHDPGEVSAIQSYLRDLDDDIERLGGFVGRTLAAEKSKEQMTGFFVGKADPQTASLFRGMGDDLDAQLERAISLLEAHCDDEDCWDRAEEAASEAIQRAYEEYTERLESMGVNPKPVC